jgi:hypothetical protein
MNRDVVGLLVHNLDPKSALELRRCNKNFNRWVSFDQVYWYYQTLGYSGRKYGHPSSLQPQEQKEIQAAGAYKVHTRKWGLSCINDRSGFCKPDYNAAYAWLLENIPEKEIEMEEIKMTAQRENMARYPNGVVPPNERIVLAGKRKVCLQFYQFLDHKFCGRAKHFEWAYKEKVVIGKGNREAMREDEGLFIYKFLFQCYRDIRKTVARIKTPQRAAATALGLRDKIKLLESQIKEAKKELAVMEDFPRLKEAVRTSIFNRKNEKSYHTSKRNERLFG